jgi:putative DNA primase/helicase
VSKWLPGGRREGHEYKCGNLQGGHGGSCSVNLVNGRWADFATGEQGGDLLSLYAAVYGLSPAKAALQVAREEGLEDVAGIVRGGAAASPSPRPAPAPKAAKPAEDEGWKTVRPVPGNAPAPTFRHHARAADDIVHTAEYRHGEQLHGYVVRFRTSDGGKETLPYTYCVSARDGACKWHWKTWDEPRPLYFPGHALPAGRTVVLVEGEKKGDALQQLLDAGAPGVYCVASWPGGCKAWKRADWSPLAGTPVMLWPDCDAKREPLTPAERKEYPDKLAQVKLQEGKPLLPAEKQPGMAAMLSIGAMLRDEHGCTVQLLPIPQPLQVPDGWDCGDAIDQDGWDFERVLTFLSSAFALPADAKAPPPAAPGAPKPMPPLALE